MKNKDALNTNRLISRRTFINLAATGTAIVAMGPVTNLFANDRTQAKSWPSDASKLRFHMIGNAHIDPVWLWPWSEGVSVVHSTFRSALERMKESPDFVFTASSAQFYEWVADNDPAMLREIRKRVNERRWNLVGGWWVEPDMNVPSGESMARQGLYGQLTLQRLLGHRAKVAFNPDSFGHTGSLPQIIKLQGMEDYVFLRPMPHEKSLPADLFWWESPDGTRVLAYRIPQSYNDGGGSVRGTIEAIMAEFRDQPMKSYMAFYGAGDHGGGATKENIRSIDELKTEKGAPTVLYSSPESYFKEVREEKYINNLPVVKDDLQHHAVGCYTAGSDIKKENRQSETALVTAEKIAAIGSAVWGSDYPAKEFTDAWKRVLFLQFHDSLAGTSLPEHFQSAREGFGYAMDIAHQATYLTVQGLEWQVPAEDPSSQYLIVFNPHAWEVSGEIEYDFFWDNSSPSRVEDEKGNALPYQWAAGSTEVNTRTKLVVYASIPPLGYRQIRLMKGDNPVVKNSVQAKENRLENEYLQVIFSTTGSVSVFDKKNGRNLFSGGDNSCKAVVIEDTSDTWSHDIRTFSNEIGTFGNAIIKILESGPLRATIRTISTYGASTLTVDWVLHAGSDKLEAKVALDWHEHHKMLKFSFPVAVESPSATYETSYGHIKRDTDGLENPGQRWIDVSGDQNGNTYGLTVVNDAKYGYSVRGNDMRISIVRSPVYAHHNPRVLNENAEYQWMDQGIQTFRMLLIPHKGSWEESNIARTADEFMAPPVAIYQGIHGGSMPKANSFLSIDVQNVIISAIKRSEQGEDIIIRCVETSGKSTTAMLDLRFVGRKWTGKFRPSEIKTLRVNKNTGNVREVNLLEE